MRAVVFFAMLPVAAAVVVAQPPAARPPTPPDPVFLWNQAALDSIQAEKTPPPVAARTLALLHVAVYDAVALSDGLYRPFYSDLRAEPGTDPAAAAAVAAHRTLLEFYPCRTREFDGVLDDTLGPSDGPAKARGVRLGQAVAERLLAWRAGDGKAALGNYEPSPCAGRWRPTPPDCAEPLLPGWGNLPCLALRDPTAFRPPGPPALDSLAYTASYRAVRAFGSATSAVRTRDQTDIARFWEDGAGTVTPPGHWNLIARSVVEREGLGLAENARLLALLNVAMADAAVVCWDCKYRFDLWRPVTAIRLEVPTWTPLLTTPPFPAYTSGHSSFSGAAAAALAAFFGTDAVKFTSAAAGLTRSFGSFSAAAEEAGVSRIYGGIHWGFDNADGLDCGRHVGEDVARNHFRPPARKGDGVTPPFGVLRQER